MSAGEQLIAILFDSIAALIGALINVTFSAVVTPFLQSVFDFVFGGGTV